MTMIIQNILAIISFLTNSLLTFLIFTKSPKTMGSYKYLMAFMTGFELVYALIDLLIQPEIVTMNSLWVTMTSSKRAIVPLSVAYPLLLLWGGSFGIALASFGAHFLYRYFIVTGNKKWVSGTTFFTFWIGIPIASGFMYVFAIDYFLQLNQVMDGIVRAKLMVSEGVPGDQLRYFSSYLFLTTPSDPVSQLDWKQIQGLIFLCSTISLSLFTMIYFGLKTFSEIRKLQDTTSVSASSKTLQTQLFYSLVIQTTIPVILIHFPTTLIYISTFFNAAPPIQGTICTITISMFPAIDPLPSLIIIKPYRQAILGMGQVALKNASVRKYLQLKPAEVELTHFEFADSKYIFRFCPRGLVSEKNKVKV
ncbi:hypothetical protein CRE_16091 [Caenorhabditis remanei]|uniref:Seven TM Receptor n=1 Tax=Caenorhabditis remanei TaxID=31234 RepID=E3MBS4_CAERE|nr:hypothetical protein CRE_16091 [Caenorhabditis remanei]